MSAAVGPSVTARVEDESELLPAIAGLAWTEGVRLLRHPIFLGGAALSIAMLAYIPKAAPGADYWALVGWGFFPLVGATLLVTNLATLRPRRDAAEDLYGSLPVGPNARTASILLSVLFAAAFSVAVLLAAYVYLGARDGLTIGWYGETAVPSARELAQGPAAVVVFGVLGVALARWLPRLAVAPIVVFAVIAGEMVIEGTTPVNRFVDHGLTWFFLFANPSITPEWSFWPCYQSPANPCDVERFAVSSAGWHLLYLGAITGLLVTLALMRAQRPRLVLASAAGPAAVVAVAALVQLP